MKRIFVASLSLILSITLSNKNSNAQSYNELLGQELNTITTAVPFLMIAPDARAGSMGDAGVATSPDANSMHWNPAKYAFIDKDFGFSVSYSPWLRKLVNDISLGYLTGYKRIDKNQTIAGSLRYFSLGEINFTDQYGADKGTFSPTEFAVDVAYARKFGDNISGAVTLRYIYSNLTGGIYVGGAESKPGQSVASDISAYYHKKIEINKKDAVLAFGANISNIGAKITYTDIQVRNFIPINMRLGGSLTMDLDEYNQIAFTADINKLLVPTPPIYALDSTNQPLVDPVSGDYVIAYGKDPNRSVVSGMFGSFSDAPGGFKEEIREFTYSLGMEYWYDKQFAIRGGFFHEHPTKGNRKYFTLGVGLRYNIVGLDFSYLIPMEQRNPLENTLRFSLVFNFGDGKTKKAND